MNPRSIRGFNETGRSFLDAPAERQSGRAPKDGNSHYGRFDPRRAVLGLTASLRLLTGYLTGWNSKTTHVYAPPYGFTPPTPPKRQPFIILGALPHKCGVPASLGTPHLCGSEASKRELPGSESQNENCCAPRGRA